MRIKALLLAIILVSLLSTSTTIRAPPNTEMKTLILAIDRARFKPEAVERLGGHVAYIAELAPIAVIRVPAHVAGRMAKLPRVLHVSEDAVVEVYKPPHRAPRQGRWRRGGGAAPAEDTLGHRLHRR